MGMFIINPKNPKDKIIYPNRDLPLKDASLEDIYGELAERFKPTELGVEVSDIYYDGTANYSIHLYHGRFPKEKDDKVYCRYCLYEKWCKEHKPMCKP